MGNKRLEGRLDAKDFNQWVRHLTMNHSSNFLFLLLVLLIGCTTLQSKLGIDPQDVYPLNKECTCYQGNYIGSFDNIDYYEKCECTP